MRIKHNLAISPSGFLFDPGTGDSYSVNPIGMEIIELLRQGKSKDDVKEHILKEYLTDEVSFEKDYYDFTTMLRKHKLTDDDKA